MQDHEFWHNKWASNKIGFHLEDVNPILINYWKTLSFTRSDSVLVPLCGKSEDLIWLASKHDNVTGVELSQIAVRSFFAEHFYTPTVTQVNGQHELYQFDELQIFTGDFFMAPLAEFELVYDRAALIALPKEMRSDYAKRVDSLLKPEGRILLVTLEYPQQEMAGPPFSVSASEIETLYPNYRVECLAEDIADETHPKIQNGISAFKEVVWKLTKQL